MIQEFNVFVDNVNSDTISLLIDYETDTFSSLLIKIKNLQLPVISSIAYVAHGTFTSTFSFSQNENFNMDDLNILGWKSFLTFLRDIEGLQFFDFLGCSLASDDKWKNVFSFIESNIQTLNIRASVDATGNLASGGNWILEDGSVDAKMLYFTNLDSFEGLLAAHTISSSEYIEKTITFDNGISISENIVTLTFDNSTEPIELCGVIDVYSDQAGCSGMFDIISSTNSTLTYDKNKKLYETKNTTPNSFFLRNITITIENNTTMYLNNDTTNNVYPDWNNYFTVDNVTPGTSFSTGSKMITLIINNITDYNIIKNIGGSVTNPLSIVKKGAGILTMSGLTTFSYVGSTHVMENVLKLNSISNSRHLFIDSGASLYTNTTNTNGTLNCSITNNGIFYTNDTLTDTTKIFTSSYICGSGDFTINCPTIFSNISNITGSINLNKTLTINQSINGKLGSIVGEESLIIDFPVLIVGEESLIINFVVDGNPSKTLEINTTYDKFITINGNGNLNQSGVNLKVDCDGFVGTIRSTVPTNIIGNLNIRTTKERADNHEFTIISPSSTVLTKSGVGHLILKIAGINIGGTVNITGGTLECNHISVNINLSDNSSIMFNVPTNNTNSINYSHSQVSSTITGTGSLIKSGPGILLLSGNNTYTGKTSIEDGVLKVQSLTTTNGVGYLGNNSTVEITGTLVSLSSSSSNRSFIVNGTIQCNVGVTTTLSGIISGTSLTKSGTGTLILNGQNTYVSGYDYATLTEKVNSTNTYTYKFSNSNNRLNKFTLYNTTQSNTAMTTNISPVPSSNTGEISLSDSQAGTYTIKLFGTTPYSDFDNTPLSITINNNAGTGADPYVYTFSGDTYKLPNIIRTYRLLENNGVIVNASISQLTQEEKEKISDRIDKHGLKADIDGYFYEKFFIGIESNYAIFDRNINYIEGNMTNDICSINVDENPKFFSCPIQGESMYKRKIIRIGELSIELRKYNNPQMVNGIDVSLRNITKETKGILNSNANPKNFKVKNIYCTKPLKKITDTKVYNRKVKDVFVDFAI